jgi:hypothetical protein
MLYQNPAIQSRVEVHLVEEAKGGPCKLLLSFLFLFDLVYVYCSQYVNLIIGKHCFSKLPHSRP